MSKKSFEIFYFLPQQIGVSELNFNIDIFLSDRIQKGVDQESAAPTSMYIVLHYHREEERMIKRKGGEIGVLKF